MGTGDTNKETEKKHLPSFGGGTNNEFTSSMPIITEEETERMTYGSDLELSMREIASQRKPWQRRGINLFESFYYILARFAFILVTFLLAEQR